MPALSFAEYADHDALGLAGLVARGEVSPVELAETAYQIIERLDPRLNAFVTLERDALERELAAGLPHGPFRGVPMAMKNCVGYVKGVERSFGSRLASGFIADHDSEVIRRYRDAGFMFVGTTNTPELSSSTTTEPVLYGPTHNPWKLGHTVGGSSGGSACVVAAGMVPVAYANDGAGSIRIPSSCCGVFGLKPSRGRVPNGPQETEFWHGWMMAGDKIQSLAENAADAAGVGQGDQRGPARAAVGRGARHAGQFAGRRRRVVEVLEHARRQHQVRMAVGQWQGGDVGDLAG